MAVEARGLAQSTDRQGVLPDRNRQGFWTYLSPAGAVAE
jgi:hypothetical protein